MRKEIFLAALLLSFIGCKTSTGRSRSLAELDLSIGMEVLVSGTYAVVGPDIVITIRAIEAESGKVLASAALKVSKTFGFEKMMAHRYDQSGASGKSSDLKENDGDGEFLDVEVGIFYEGGNGKLYPIREGMVLTSDDNYVIYVKVRQASHIYIYQVDSSQKAFKIFPNKQFSSLANPLKVGKDYWIPEGRKYLYLDKNPGRETIFILATRKAAPPLEEIKITTLADIHQTIRTMGIGGVRDSIVMSKSKGTSTEAMDLVRRKLVAKGDFFYSLSFIHQH